MLSGRWAIHVAAMLVATCACMPVQAQDVTGWLPPAPADGVTAPLRELNKPAQPGKVIIRAKSKSELLRLAENIAKEFAGGNGLDVASDDFASMGRFCDQDNPFDVLIAEGVLMLHDKQCWRRRFPAGTPQPASFLLGQLKVVGVVHESNPIRSLTLAQIGKVLGEDGKTPIWREIGGAGGNVSCYGPPENTWISRIIQDKCMSGWQTTDTPNVRQMVKLAYRKDLVNGYDAKEIIRKVRADRNGLGFFAYDGQLSTQDIRGVKIIPIVASDGESPAMPSFEPLLQDGYALSVPVFLYVHPTAGKEAMEFALHCVGEQGATIASQYGLVTPHREREYHGERRLAEAKVGKGARLSTIGADTLHSPFQDLATEYVRVKEVVQLSYAAVDVDVSSISAFITGGEGNRELLLLGDKPSGGALELHGEKWLALGMDEKGQPTGGGPKEHMIAGRATAIIVNAANKLESLTLGQVQAIFSGEVNDWSVIGSTGLIATPGSRTSTIPVNRFGLQANEPAAGVFHKEGLPPSKFKRVVLKKDTAEAVAAVSMDPQAIAFVDLAAIPGAGQTVKVLPIQIGTGDRARIVSPTPENIRNAMYPLSQRLYLYVHPKASDTAKDFANFVATCGGSEANPYVDTVKAMIDTYQKHGLIPLADAALERMVKDEADAAAAILQTEATTPKGK